MQTHVYDVKRYDIIVNSIGNDDAALPYFCFGSLCYPNIAMFSTQSLTLNPGQNSKSVGSGPDSAYFSLNIDLLEATARGLSEIKYTIFNTLNPNDSVQVTARYNDPQFVGIAHHSALQTPMHFQPNPAKESTVFIINTTIASEGLLQLINSVGQVVFSQTLSLSSGKNTFPLQVSNLAAGMYVAQLSEGGKISSQKLVIE